MPLRIHSLTTAKAGARLQLDARWSNTKTSACTTYRLAPATNRGSNTPSALLWRATDTALCGPTQTSRSSAAMAATHHTLSSASMSRTHSFAAELSTTLFFLRRLSLPLDGARPSHSLQTLTLSNGRSSLLRDGSLSPRSLCHNLKTSRASSDGSLSTHSLPPNAESSHSFQPIPPTPHSLGEPHKGATKSRLYDFTTLRPYEHG